MRSWLILLLYGLTAGSALAQVTADDQTPMAGLEIRGVVNEPGANGAVTPVSGMEITLTEFRLVEMRVTPTVAATAVTDNRGAFIFHPSHLGRFIMDARKEGYRAAGSIGTDPNITISAEFSRQQLSQTVEFRVTRLGSLSGRIVDENNQPLSRVKLEVFRQGVPIPSGTGISDENGVFRVGDLPPAGYLVRVVSGKDHPIADTSQDADLPDTVDHGLETSYWPGGPGAAPTPVVIQSGGQADLGTIQVSNVAYYRARVAVQSEGCPTEERWSVQVIPASQASAAGLNFSPPNPLRCEDVVKSGFLIRNLPPGSYWVALVARVNGVESRWASEQITIVRENARVEMKMTPMSRVTVKLVAAEGAKAPDVRTLILNTRPLMTGVIGDFSGPFDAKGERTLLLPWPAQRLNINFFMNSPAVTSYVQQIRSNGQPLVDGIMQLAGAPMTVEVVVDDRGGTVTGTVQDGDKATAQAQAMMVQWPIAPPVEGSPSVPRLFSSVGIPSETFQIQGLAPGEYRIFAVPRSGLDALITPAVIERMAAQGQKIVVERGGSQTISVKLIDLSRI